MMERQREVAIRLIEAVDRAMHTWRIQAKVEEVEALVLTLEQAKEAFSPTTERDPSPPGMGCNCGVGGLPGPGHNKQCPYWDEGYG